MLCFCCFYRLLDISDSNKGWIIVYYLQYLICSIFQERTGFHLSALCGGVVL